MTEETANTSRLYTRLNVWRLAFLRGLSRHVPGSVILILIAFVIGILTGVAAAVLKRLISFIGMVLIFGVNLDEPDLRLLIFPLVGILITSIFQRYVVRGNVAQGTKIIRRTLDSGNYRMSLLTAFNSVIGCSLTIGFGASGGSEGPTALAGSALASNIGRFFKLPQNWMRLMVAIGGGAGISAIFKSPMGGALFALEVLQMEFSTLSVLALIIACLFASSTAYVLSDFTFDIEFIRQLPMDPSTLGWVALLGVFCGLYSIYYNFTKSKSQKLFMAIRNPWLGALATGIIMSIGIFMVPCLFGEGFGVIESLVNGAPYSFTEAGILADVNGSWVLFVGVAAALLLKGILVAAAYSNGGVAGDFVPTFFAGALAGYLFGISMNSLLGMQLPVWYFALIGMGCVMAGTIHAPLMSIFILCETTNTYGYIFPYLLAIAISYATVKILTPKSWNSGTDHDDIAALMAANKDFSIKPKL